MGALTLLVCLDLVLIAGCGFVVYNAAPSRFENRILAAYCATRFLDTLVQARSLFGVAWMSEEAALVSELRFSVVSIYLLQLFAWSFPFNRRPPVRVWLALALAPALPFLATWGDLPALPLIRTSALLLQVAALCAALLLGRNLRRIQNPDVARGVRALAVCFPLMALLTSAWLIVNTIVNGGPPPVPWIVGFRLAVSSAFLVIGANIVLRHNLLSLATAGAEMFPWFTAALLVTGSYLGRHWLGLSLFAPYSNPAAEFVERVAGVALFVGLALLLRAPLARVVRLLDPKGAARREAARRARVEVGRLADPVAVRARIAEAIAETVPGARMDVLRANDPLGLLADEKEAIEPALAEEVGQRGFLVREHLGLLPPGSADRFEAMGGDLFLPLGRQGRVVGVVRIEAPVPILQPAIDDLRSLVELWAYKLEAHRAHAELEAARRLALLGSFAAGVAHDLRTPLNAMRLNLEILREGSVSLTPSEREFLDTAIGEVDRMSRHVSDLLDCARPAAVRGEPCDLGLAIREALADIASLRTERRLEVRANVPSPLLVRGDRVRLRQVFRNLLENAGQASFPGGPIEVSADVADGEVAVRVRDWGKGVAPAELSRIFEPFFTTRRGGTGLGLSIVRNLVDAHGGRVSMRSDPGEGTEFCVGLPMWRGPSGTADSPV